MVVKVIRTFKQIVKKLCPTMLWRKLQSMRQAIARHQEQKNFNTLFQSRTICAPSAFAPLSSPSPHLYISRACHG
ncbi:hypothetical protein, partial [Helicobacter typhlonius]|uniref:hypothetical protein n=1 Tax=Helicobacter typhlonius TaxID=76936 RepID=UPI002FE3C3AE